MKTVNLKYALCNLVRCWSRRQQSGCGGHHCQLFGSVSSRRRRRLLLYPRHRLIIVITCVWYRLLQHAGADLAHFAAGHHQCRHLAVFRLGLALQVERDAVYSRVQHAHHDQRRPEVAHLQPANRFQLIIPRNHHLPLPSGVTGAGVTRGGNRRCHPYFLPKKNWRPVLVIAVCKWPVSYRLVTTPTFRPPLSSVLSKFSHNFFYFIRVSPPGGCHPGRSAPRPPSYTTAIADEIYPRMRSASTRCF